MLLRFSPLLVLLGGISLGAQDPQTFLRLTQQQQDDAVKKQAFKAVALFTAPRGDAVPADQVKAYELNRTFGNFIAVLFLPNPNDPAAKLASYDDIRRQETKRAKASSHDDLAQVIGAYLEEAFRFLDEDGGRLTAALPKLASESNTEQVNFLRKLYNQRDQEIKDAADKQYAENEKQYARMEKQDESLLKFSSDLHQMLAADQVDLELQRLALDRPYPNSDQIVATWKRQYLPILQKIRSDNVASFTSRMDKQGNAKSPERLQLDQHRLAALNATFEKYDYKDIAFKIDQQIRTAPQTDPGSFLPDLFRERFNGHLREELAKPAK